MWKPFRHADGALRELEVARLQPESRRRLPLHVLLLRLPHAVEEVQCTR